MKMLEVEDLSMRYRNGKQALNGVSFSFDSNGIFALIGRNGAGKTTIIRILATQLLQSGGSARLFGIDIAAEPGQIREQIAIVPQEAKTIPWLSPRELIYSYLLWHGFSIKEAKGRTKRVLKQFDLEKYADRQSQFLSGGVKRKVLVASALASDARVVFLDEPTTGLDPMSRAQLWAQLRKIKRKKLIFLTTHYLDEAEKLADSIGIIEGGRILRVGTLHELRESIRYPYSIKIFDKSKKVSPGEGVITEGVDGGSQILTTEQNAYAISRKLVRRGIKFSLSPVSLDDIFYYIVKRSLEGDEDE